MQNANQNPNKMNQDRPGSNEDRARNVPQKEGREKRVDEDRTHGAEFGFEEAKEDKNLGRGNQHKDYDYQSDSTDGAQGVTDQRQKDRLDRDYDRANYAATPRSGTQNESEQVNQSREPSGWGQE